MARKASEAKVKQESPPEETCKRIAMKGEGADPKKISTMLGLLKYQANKGKNPDRASECAEALTVYNALADTQGKKPQRAQEAQPSKLKAPPKSQTNKHQTKAQARAKAQAQANAKANRSKTKLKQN